MARKLTTNDVGRVFSRADQDIYSDELLLLRSIGPGPNEIYSFITFQVIGDKLMSIGDSGYINGPWYEQVDSISPHQIDQIHQAYDLYVKHRLIGLRSQIELNNKRQAKYRNKFQKPETWVLLQKKEFEVDQSLFYILWMDEENSLYILEIYNEENKLLDQISKLWSHAPDFGMSYDDAHSLFGEEGILENLVNNINGC